MTAIKAIGSLITLVCFILLTIVNYHVVQSAAPNYFTMWAVSTTLYFIALVITLIAKSED
jgi:hypothetical protein